MSQLASVPFLGSFPVVLTPYQKSGTSDLVRWLVNRGKIDYNSIIPESFY